MDKKLMHDASVAMAHAILDLVSPCLREEEKLEALSNFYIVCQAGIESYCIKTEKMLRNVEASNN